MLRRPPSFTRTATLFPSPTLFRSYLVGSEIVLGTDWGTIGGDVAFSHLPAGGNGWAANFSLERVTQGTANGSSLIATVEARSRRFGAVGQLAPDNPYQYNAMISYNKSIDEGSFVGVQARYAHARRGDRKSTRLNSSH